MKDFLLTADGDLDLDSGSYKDFQFETDEDREIGQRLTMNLRSFTNDWFIDYTDGLPYFDDILIKNPDTILLQSLIVSAVLETEGIENLLSFEYDLDIENRSLTVYIKAQTENSIIETNVNIL